MPSKVNSLEQVRKYNGKEENLVEGSGYRDIPKPRLYILPCSFCKYLFDPARAIVPF
jgi:hypothetical protein